MITTSNTNPVATAMHGGDAERREQRGLRGLANADAALRDRRQPRDLRQRPHEQPHVQRNVDADQPPEFPVQHDQRRLQGQA